MSTKRKRKRKIKIKKKNFVIFLICIFLIIFIPIKLINIISKTISSNKTEEKITKKKELSTKEEKLNKLNNIDKDISYFNYKYLDRYLKYKEKNKDLSNKQIVKNVNMNLDLMPYEDIIKAKNLETEKVLVNKYYYLEEDYVPKNLERISNQYALGGMKLTADAKEAFEKMAKAAKEEDLSIIAMSSYRSYNYQVDLYNRYAKKDGEEAADTYSGRPGHSEHQTGLAVDVYNEDEDYTNFEETEEYEWMQEHANEYGFILRFPKGKEEETGYQFESWHYRYVGVEIATYIKEKDISFEEYYATIIKEW